VRLFGWTYAGDVAEIATWPQAVGRAEPATLGQLIPRSRS
jgi:hypothetical protein